MLELRVIPDALRIASMREEIRCESERAHAGARHAAMVAYVAEQLVWGDLGPSRPRRRFGRSAAVLVVVNVQSDATMLIVREPNAETADLGDLRLRLLEECTTRWSTMVGRDGRTVWAEIARPADPDPVLDAAAPPVPEVVPV
jgi:hypothetical protein